MPKKLIFEATFVKRIFVHILVGRSEKGRLSYQTGWSCEKLEEKVVCSW